MRGPTPSGQILPDGKGTFSPSGRRPCHCGLRGGSFFGRGPVAISPGEGRKCFCGEMRSAGRRSIHGGRDGRTLAAGESPLGCGDPLGGGKLAVRAKAPVTVASASSPVHKTLPAPFPREATHPAGSGRRRAPSPASFPSRCRKRRATKGRRLDLDVPWAPQREAVGCHVGWVPRNNLDPPLRAPRSLPAASAAARGVRSPPTLPGRMPLAPPAPPGWQPRPPCSAQRSALPPSDLLRRMGPPPGSLRLGSPTPGRPHCGWTVETGARPRQRKAGLWGGSGAEVEPGSADPVRSTTRAGRGWLQG